MICDSFLCNTITDNIHSNYVIIYKDIYNNNIYNEFKKKWINSNETKIKDI